MANLKFCDTHNMVAYLNKSKGSEGFHKIVDFLNHSHISTLDSGEIKITATIDGKVKIITEASIRRNLKLEDSDGISTFPTTETFEQLALMGSPTQTPAANKAASTGVDVRHGWAATTLSSLDVGQGSGNIDKTPTMPHDSPILRVHTLGSDEGKMQHNELMDFVTKLLDRVVALETDLRQTKKVYGAAYTKLIKKVKKLERAAKSSQSRRRANIVVSDDEDEIHGRHGQEMEFETKVYTAKDVSTTGAAVTTASAFISTASPPGDSTAEDISTAETLVYIRRSAAKDKGMAKMDEYELE
ncbi:hypothetical protein Tco_0038160 [Tanacetum coccineum]